MVTPERYRKFIERGQRINRRRPECGTLRYHDHRLHDCGCETAFDCDEWRSVAFVRCDEHDRSEAAGADS